MEKKELIKKYWFIGLIAVLLIAFIGLYSYDAYNNRDVVIRNKQIDGKYVAYTIDDEPVYADDLYDSLYKDNGPSQAIVAFERAIFDAAYETTDEMKNRAASNAASVLSYYSQDYLVEQLKAMGYVNGIEDLTQYYIDSEKQELLMKDYILAHKEEYLNDSVGTNGRLIYHILVKCDVEPIYDEENNIIGYEALPTEEQTDKLNSILSELAAGENSFEYIAYTYSEDGSSSSGGYIGAINEENRGNYDRFFADAAMSLADGEVSDPVVSQFGYHIIKNMSSVPEEMLDNYNFINDITSQYSDLSIKAIFEKATELGFEIKDEELKTLIDRELGNEEE
ncbi:MAG: peptidylprolyl isomerase [Erysipelotrichaceae bacterium]|nr:peptidylprolyl isomerase [Erysipelotrichaceae bacterium]